MSGRDVQVQKEATPLSSAGSSQTSLQETSLHGLMHDLDDYRHFLLPLHDVLVWEHAAYPVILVGASTVLFSIIYGLEPSVLTIFSLLGLVLCLMDFTAPFLSNYLFGSNAWSEVHEQKYEYICKRIFNAKMHISNFFAFLSDLKVRKPKVYLILMMTVFAFTAWVGSLIDNLFLTYLLFIFIVLVPGLRKRGILQKVVKPSKTWALSLVGRSKEE